jgi:16S rRNA (cytidine1402-2'-O)-methyltransferase
MLYIVATPIGNLKDITLRALEILKEVDFILCEDTRVTRNLLNHYEIKDKKLISYHQHTSENKLNELIKLVENNKVALVTDAGTPGISDPGGQIIKALKHPPIRRAGENIKTNEEIKIVPIPGPTAVTAALSVSGFPTDNFLFLGFPPHKKGREKFFKEALAEKRTVVFYESCHRIVKCLEQIITLIDADKNADNYTDNNADNYTDRARINTDSADEGKQFVVCRELTKMFESIYRGNIEEVLEKVKTDPIKGEYVVVIN